jgi:hypothetical protein
MAFMYRLVSWFTVSRNLVWVHHSSNQPNYYYLINLLNKGPTVRITAVPPKPSRYSPSGCDNWRTDANPHRVAIPEHHRGAAIRLPTPPPFMDTQAPFSCGNRGPDTKPPILLITEPNRDAETMGPIVMRQVAGMPDHPLAAVVGAPIMGGGVRDLLAVLRLRSGVNMRIIVAGEVHWACFLPHNYMMSPPK